MQTRDHVALNKTSVAPMWFHYTAYMSFTFVPFAATLLLFGLTRIYLTNRLHFFVRVYCNRSRMTSLRVKNKKYDCCCDCCSLHAVTSSVIYYRLSYQDLDCKKLSLNRANRPYKAECYYRVLIIRTITDFNSCLMLERFFFFFFFLGGGICKISLSI